MVTSGLNPETIDKYRQVLRYHMVLNIDFLKICAIMILFIEAVLCNLFLCSMLPGSRDGATVSPFLGLLR